MTQESLKQGNLKTPYRQLGEKQTKPSKTKLLNLKNWKLWNTKMQDPPDDLQNVSSSVPESR